MPEYRRASCSRANAPGAVRAAAAVSVPARVLRPTSVEGTCPILRRLRAGRSAVARRRDVGLTVPGLRRGTCEPGGERPLGRLAARGRGRDDGVDAGHAAARIRERGPAVARAPELEPLLGGEEPAAGGLDALPVG